MERIRIRTAAAGAAVELVVVSVLLALAAGLGIWKMGEMDAAAVGRLGAGFMIWGAIAWIAAAFVGGFVASTLDRAPDERDGTLLGLLSWVFACGTAGILSCTWLMAAVAVGMASKDLGPALTTQGVVLPFVIGDALAFVAAILGGRAGARSESKARLRHVAPGAARTASPA